MEPSQDKSKDKARDLPPASVIRQFILHEAAELEAQAKSRNPGGNPAAEGDIIQAVQKIREAINAVDLADEEKARRELLEIYGHRLVPMISSTARISSGMARGSASSPI